LLSTRAENRFTATSNVATNKNKVTMLNSVI